jgi:hypothetical protein
VIRPSLWLDQERNRGGGPRPEAVGAFSNTGADTTRRACPASSGGDTSQLAAVLATGRCRRHSVDPTDLSLSPRDVHPKRSATCSFLLCQP